MVCTRGNLSKIQEELRKKTLTALSAATRWDDDLRRSLEELRAQFCLERRDCFFKVPFSVGVTRVLEFIST